MFVEKCFFYFIFFINYSNLHLSQFHCKLFSYFGPYLTNYFYQLLSHRFQSFSQFLTKSFEIWNIDGLLNELVHELVSKFVTLLFLFVLTNNLVAQFCSSFASRTLKIVKDNSFQVQSSVYLVGKLCSKSPSSKSKVEKMIGKGGSLIFCIKHSRWPPFP